MADEDLHAFGPQALIEQVQDVALFVNASNKRLSLSTLEIAWPIRLVSPAMTYSMPSSLRLADTCWAIAMASSITWLMSRRVSSELAQDFDVASALKAPAAAMLVHELARARSSSGA